MECFRLQRNQSRLRYGQLGPRTAGLDPTLFEPLVVFCEVKLGYSVIIVVQMCDNL